MKKILITGNSGFIGVHLTRLLSSKYKVIGFGEKRIKGVKMIKKDITQISPNDLKNVFCVIHLAAITNTKFCEDSPYECFKTNILGTEKVLEAAKKNNCKVIFASTSHVYGNPSKIPISEDAKTKSTSIYSASKLTSEILCEAYHQRFNLDIAIARIFSVYGTESSKHYVIPNIISQLQNSNVIKLGNIESKRDFIFISDVVEAIEIILKNIKGFEIYNIGMAKSYSIRQVCKILEEIFGKKIIIEKDFKQKRVIDPKNIISRNLKMKKLGWKPKVNLTEGLKQCVQEMQSKKIT